MTVAIKRSNNEIIFIDAVLQFSRQYSGSVSKNPIENGSSVTDHVTTENPVFTINGVVSDADFNIDRPLINAADASSYSLANRTYVNDDPVLFSPIIGGNAINPLTKYLPQSVTQFLGDTVPSISYIEQEDRDDISTRISSLVESKLLEIFDKKEEVVILVFEKKGVVDVITKMLDQCILTNLSFDETPESGMALYPNMTFERITKVVLKTTTLPANVSSAVASGSATKKSEGKQTAITGDKPTTTGDNAKTEKTEVSSELQEDVPLESVVSSIKDLANKSSNAFGLGSFF